MKIAIVEDDIELNKLISRILKKEGFEVDSFFNAQEVLKSNLNYDLYLIDINLPKINGLDLIDLINGKIIIISAKTDSKTIDLAYKKGVEDFIKKPFIKEELLHKLNKIFPKEVKIKDFILKPKERILIKDKTYILTKTERDFLMLFSKKEFATLEEIESAINKRDNSLYVFLSKFKKKTGIEFENIKGFGYKIKEQNDK